MTARTGRPGWGALVIALFLGLVGLTLGAGGIYLVTLGGSAYYALAGLGCLVAGFLYARGRSGALGVYCLVLAGTLAWAFAEVGADFWQLVPRVAGPVVVLVVLLLHDIARRQGTRAALVPTGLASAAAIIAVIGMRTLPATTGGTETASALAAGQGTDWRSYGNLPGGTRFAEAGQITPANVGNLEVAWTYRTGDGPKPGEKMSPAFQATPLKVGDKLYLCSGRNRVVALDAESGKEIWQFDAELDASKTFLLNCRGVSYYEAPAGTGDCPRRIITGTLDARIISLDADTGKRCTGFGTDGEISVNDRLGAYTPGFYLITSPPVVASDMIVVNAYVQDGMTTDIPGGVVRGYSAVDGKLVWSWDPGRIDENALPDPKDTYRRGTPNSWSVMSVDPALGLVYLPTGNATPDYVGMHRSAESNRYSTSIVALDLKTGVRRWNFQTLHRDIFDLDVPAQPVLFDWPLPNGSTVPAVAQPTKQGYIYILDRRTGEPLNKVVERPAPKGRIAGETYSPTQPAQIGFPDMIPPALTEKDMWGATAFDQLWCRIRFRQLDYRGLYTPPSVEGSLQFPGNMGFLNWGSVSIDPQRGIMITNAEYMPIETRLIPRKEADRRMAKSGSHVDFQPQQGTPYGISTPVFLSPLGLPCTAPPWGRIAAIDLKTRQFLWNKPFGTSKDHAPLGIAVPGVFNIGGSITTAGGVTFIGAAIDRYIRAYDTRTGAELWRRQMPAGGQATPMSYISGKSGRQFVVIAAGGSGLLQAKTGDYVIAYALPKK